MFWHNYPFYQQNNLRDCGVACLRMVAAYHGKKIGAEQLRSSSGIDKVGTSFLGLQNAAKKIGFRAEGVLLRSADDFDLLENELPCILFWNNNHFVVLYKVGHDKYTIGDPASGMRKFTKAEVEEFTFVKRRGTKYDHGAFALLLEPEEAVEIGDSGGLELNGLGKKQWTFLYDIVKKLKIYFFVIILGIIATSILQYMLPFITKSVVDLGIGAGDLNFIKFLLIGQLAIVLSKTFFNILRSWVVLHLSIRINYSLIANFLQKLFRLPLPFFETRKIGDILQRITDHNRIESFLTRNSLSILIATLSIIVYSVVLYHFHALFFWMFVGAATIYGIWTSVFLKTRKSIDIERFQLSSKNKSILIQTINGMHDLKINNSEAYSFEKWKTNQLDFFKNTFRFLKVNQIQETGTMLIIELSQLSILFLSASLIVNNQITLGTLLSIQFIIGQLIAPMEQIVQGVIRGQEAKISFDRIYEFWKAKEESEYSDGHKIDLPIQENKAITLKNLSFTHPGQRVKPALKEVNLRIPFGKTTAIVGMSGSGKTTMLKLLLGYYFDYTGQVNIGDHSFRELDIKAWRDHCGVILQESYIFDDTIQNNITLSNEVDEDRLEKSINICNLREFVEDMPQGYDTPIGRDGKGLSMGQKQRILMARAVYKDPAFVFMDEATNSLDADNEQVIMDNLQRFFNGRTVIVVAHRLSTIQFADNIVVLDKGRLVEQGSHRELLKQGGKYYDLIKKQM